MLEKASRILYILTWLLSCLALAILCVLAINKFNPIQLAVIGGMFAYMIFTSALIATLLHHIASVDERNERLWSALGTPRQYVHVSDVGTLYIREEDIPEIIDYLYALQTKEGLV